MRRREFNLSQGLRGAAIWPLAQPFAAEAQRRVVRFAKPHRQ
jgi:hypothetical protein